jgi:hypothetical protein
VVDYPFWLYSPLLGTPDDRNRLIIFNIKGGGSTFLRNVAILLPDFQASYSIIQKSSQYLKADETSSVPETSFVKFKGTKTYGCSDKR